MAEGLRDGSGSPQYRLSGMRTTSVQPLLLLIAVLVLGAHNEISFKNLHS